MSRSARARARVRALVRALVRAGSRSRALDNALALADILQGERVDRTHALNLAYHRALEIDRCLAHDRTRSLVLALALALDLDLDQLANDPACAYREFRPAVRDAASAANNLVRLLQIPVWRTSTSLTTSKAVQPARWAQQLAQAAVRVLPVADRARYGDECRSELYELAAAGVSRSRQLLYAVRLLDRAWVLRAELRAPAHRRARS